MDTETILGQLKQRLTGISDIVYQPLQIGPVGGFLIYIQSIVDTVTMREAIIKPLLEKVSHHEVELSFYHMSSAASFLTGNQPFRFRGAAGGRHCFG